MFSEKRFDVIEFLLVIALIAAFAAVLTPSVSTYLEPPSTADMKPAAPPVDAPREAGLVP